MTRDEATKAAWLLNQNGIEAEAQPFAQNKEQWQVWVPDPGVHLVHFNDIYDFIYPMRGPGE